MIDPKRLTEADKGREVEYFPPGDMNIYGRIQTWENGLICVGLHGHSYYSWLIPRLLQFAHGTYQDGGAE